MSLVKWFQWEKVFRFLVCLLSFFIVEACMGKKAGAYENGDYVFSVKNGKATITSYSGGVNVKIPATLKGYPVVKIGNNAFEENWDIQSVRFPEGLQVIGKNAFRKCYGLKALYFPKSVTKIEDGAFESCGGVTVVKFAGNKKISFGKRVFQNTRITTITIPSGTEALPAGFAEGTFLKKATLPASIKTIGAKALSSWDLKEIVFGGTVAQWKSVRRDYLKSGAGTGDWGSWVGVKFRCKDGTIKNGKVTGAAAKKKNARLLKAPAALRAKGGKKAAGKLVLSWKKAAGAVGYVVSQRYATVKEWRVFAATKGTSVALENRVEYSAGIAGDTSSVRTDCKFMVQAYDKNMNLGAPAILKYEYPNLKRHEDGYLIHIGKDYYDPLIRYMTWRTGTNVDGFEVEYTVSYRPKTETKKGTSKRKVIHKTVRMNAQEDVNRLDLGSYEEFVNISVKVRPYKKEKNGDVFGAIYSRAYDDSRYLQQTEE